MAEGPPGLELPMRKSEASVATALRFSVSLASPTPCTTPPTPPHTAPHPHTQSIWKHCLISLLHANLHLGVWILGNPILFSPFLSGLALYSPSSLLLLYLHRLGLREEKEQEQESSILVLSSELNGNGKH